MKWPIGASHSNGSCHLVSTFFLSIPFSSDFSIGRIATHISHCCRKPSLILNQLIAAVVCRCVRYSLQRLFTVEKCHVERCQQLRDEIPQASADDYYSIECNAWRNANAISDWQTEKGNRWLKRHHRRRRQVFRDSTVDDVAIADFTLGDTSPDNGTVTFYCRLRRRANFMPIVSSRRLTFHRTTPMTTKYFHLFVESIKYLKLSAHGTHTTAAVCLKSSTKCHHSQMRRCTQTQCLAVLISRATQTTWYAVLAGKSVQLCSRFGHTFNEFTIECCLLMWYRRRGTITIEIKLDRVSFDCSEEIKRDHLRSNCVRFNI